MVLAASAAFAADVPQKQSPEDEKVSRAIRDSVMQCNGSQIMQGDFDHPLPAGMKATLIEIQSDRPQCKSQYVGVVTSSGGFYLGLPWFIDEQKGTIEEKLKAFMWQHMQENVTANVDRNRTPYGLYKVTLVETTERGKLPMEGEVDPNGSVFFLGHFRPLNEDVRTVRAKMFEPYVAGSPSQGATKPVVTVIEFSDFECPSCMHASHYLEPILAKYGDKVKYVRYDLPLVSMHPWALSAAVAGRAVYRQKPDLFWEYKKQVYTNQDKLNAFNFDDFAANFAKDHELDLPKFEADIASAELRDEILKGAGFALSNDIRATPSYIVNGIIIDAGNSGEDLEKYIASQLK